MTDNERKEQRTKLLDFDPDFSPYESHNKEAARQRSLRYDPKRRAYVEQDGFLILDRFGQPLG